MKRFTVTASVLAGLLALAGGCGKYGPPVRAPEYREGYVTPPDTHFGESELEEDAEESEVETD